MGKHSLPKRKRLGLTTRRPAYGADEQYAAEIHLMTGDVPTMPFPVITAEDLDDVGLNILDEVSA